MPTNFSTSIFGTTASVDDLFVTADSFRQGNLWNWGSNSYGQLGTNLGYGSNRNTPVTTFGGGGTWKQVASVNLFTAAIKTDGTLWCWGDNYAGNLGTNTVSAFGTGFSTPLTTFAGGTNWKQVSCGSRHTAAVKTDGTLWIWGQGGSGRLGNNASINISTPITTSAGGTNWKQVSCGGVHTAAVKTDGTLWTWGINGSGQLGDNTQTQRLIPVTTFAGGNNWKQVASGEQHISAIKTDGTLWTWGQNPNGQLGDNTTTNRSTPVTTFSGGTNWKQVSCGGYFTVAVKTDGTLWTWGLNAYAQLGVNDTTNRSIPVTTFAGGTNWKQSSAGRFHSAAIKTDGTLWVWGRNISSQLGINNSQGRSTPVTTFIGGTNWKQTSCGRNHSVAVTYIDDYQ